MASVVGHGHIYLEFVDQLLPMEQCNWLQQCLQKYSDRSDFFEIKKNQFGKPFVSNTPNIFVSRSHTKIAPNSYANVYLIANENTIGVDIESFQRETDLNLISEYFFQMPRMNEFSRLSKQSKTELFLRAWTRMESYFKALHESAMTPLTAEELFFRDNIDVGDHRITSLKVTESLMLSVTHRRTLQLVFHPPREVILQSQTDVTPSTELSLTEKFH